MTAQQLKNSILQLAVQGKLVPQDKNDEPASELLKQIRAEKAQLIKDGKIKKEKALQPITEEDIPFDIPESWEWVRLGELCTKLTDGTHYTPKYTESGIPFLSVKDVSSGKLNFNNCKFISKEEHKELFERCNPEKGDLLVTKVGTTGVPVVVDTDKEFSLFVSVALLKTNWELVNVNYLCQLIKSPLVYSQVKENTKGVGNKNWVIKDIANTILVIPPLAEQQRIVDKIDEYMPLVEAYGVAEEQRNKLDEELPEKLKKSILQQAMQGKLVAQDKNDEPASELLKRIKAEKIQLIKDGKIKKEKPLPPITEDEVPFDIPESWEWVRLGELCNIINGFTPLRSNADFWNSKDIPWFTVADIHTQGREIRQTQQYISKSALTENTNRIVPADTVLLCCTASVGEYAIARIALTTNQQFNGLVIKEDYKTIFSANFLFNICPYFKTILIDSAGKTTFNFISVAKVSNIIIPLPPLAEQQRIVDKIEEYMSLCEQLKNGEFIGNSENFAKIIPFVPNVAQEEPLLAVARGETADKKPSKQLLSAIDELFEDE